MFSCQEIKAFVDSFVDEEFDAQEYAEVELHLVHCKECRALVEYRLQFKKLIAKSLKTEAPVSLKNKIFASLDDDDFLISNSSSSLPSIPLYSGTEKEVHSKDTFEKGNVCRLIPPSDFEKTPDLSDSFKPEAKEKKPRTFLANFGIPHAQQTAAIIAALAAIALFIAFVPQWTVAPATTEGLSVWEESVDWYRSDFPMEVHGPDVRAVTDWFHNKVNFKVEPLSFGTSQEGVDAHLVGGRLASIFNRRAALLDYKVDGVTVTVLVFDGEGITVPADKLQTFDNQKIAVVEGPGYDVALFHRNDLTYTITTNLPTARFNQLIHQVLKANK